MTVPIGQGLAQGVGLGMTQIDLSGSAGALAASAKATLSAALPPAAFRSIGVNAMAGLAQGILSGRVSVVSAMRGVADAAVNAAKARLRIESPSKVFRDEIGVMMVRGISEGAEREAKRQRAVIANAARYLTGAAKEGAHNTVANDNRRSYHADNSVAIDVDRLVVNDKQDIRALALELNALNRRWQFGYGG